MVGCRLWFQVLMVTAFVTVGAQAQEAVSDPERPVVSYGISAELLSDDEGRHRVIAGQVLVTWRNPAEAPTQELLWHVYNNAWAGRDSLWLTEARLMGDERVPRRFGSTEIQRVRRLSGPEDRAGVDLPWQFVPQPEAPNDRTVLRASLPEPVAPGGAVTVLVEFRATLPWAFRRSGIGGDYVHAAQWFPKLGVFEAVGGGAPAWNCEPYHYLTEFYADYGDYELTLTLPSIYKGKVAATGSPVGDPLESRERQQVIYRFQASRVHDFAWTADPDFRVVRRPFDPAAVARRTGAAADLEQLAAALQRPAAELQPQATEMLLFLQPEHGEYEERYLTALENALYFFQLWYGPYPYETISLIDPAHAAQATGGMEYPRLITGGIELGKPPRTLDPEGVTVHEFGHQYWYGLVGNDEFRHAWLDEGLNTFSSQRVLRRSYPPALATYRVLGRDFYGQRLHRLPSYEAGDLRAFLSLQRFELPDVPVLGHWSLELRRRTDLEQWLAELPEASYLPEQRRDAVFEERTAFAADWADPLSRPTFRLFNAPMRGVNAYRRPAMTLETMAGLMGEERWARTMRAFHERWRFRHPQPDDFYAAAAEFGLGARIGSVAGAAVDWPGFWQQAYHGNEELDFGVSRVENAPAVADPNARTGGLSADRFDVVVEVRRYGGFRVPVEIELRWDDGSRAREIWDGEDWWWRYRAPGSARRITEVVVDPERRLLLDRNWLNNTRRAAPDTAGARRLAWRVLLWAEQVLHHYGGIG